MEKKGLKNDKTNLSQKEQHRLDSIYAGICFKLKKEGFEDYTWQSLYEEIDAPYDNAESYRCAVKDFQEKLREPDGTAKHKFALPRAKNNTEKIIELKKERAKLSSLRLDINKKIREEARYELLLEEFVRAAKEQKYYKPKFERVYNQKGDVEYFLAFSDPHWGKKFASINNEYSIEIAEQRFDLLYNEICDIIDREGITKLNIINNGDSAEGMHLRISQIQGLQIGLVDQVMQFSIMLINWLKKLSEKVYINYYGVKASNHTQTRPFGAKPNEFVLEDMERMVTYHLTLAFENCKRVNIVIPEGSFHVIDTFGYKIIVLHGHETRDYKNLLKNRSWKHREFYDYAFVGHRHAAGIIPSGEGATNDCEILQVPSMMGTDDYADYIGVGAKAGALFVSFTRKQGRRIFESIILN